MNQTEFTLKHEVTSLYELSMGKRIFIVIHLQTGREDMPRVGYRSNLNDPHRCFRCDTQTYHLQGGCLEMPGVVRW
jgi:hypothetical protein